MASVSTKIKSRIIEYKYIISISVIALFLRLLGLLNVRYAGDNIMHWTQAGNIIKHGQFPLLGPSASINPSLHLGPFYYYFLSLPYLLGSGDFRASIIFSCVLGALSVIILYFFAIKFFSKRISIQISILFAFSAYMINVQSFPWNPYALPFFITLILYLITKVREGKYYLLPFISFLFGASIQLHATVLFLIPVIFYLLPIKKIPVKVYIISIVFFFFVLSPWIYYDLYTNFSQSKEAIFALLSPHNQQCSFYYWIFNHGHGEYCFSIIRNTLFSFRLFTMSLFNTTNILIVLVVAAVTVRYLLRVKSKNRNMFLVWLFVPMFFFLFYKSNIYIHYFLILIPLPFLIFTAILSGVEQKFKRGKIIGNIIIFLLVIWNMAQYLYSLNFSKG